MSDNEKVNLTTLRGRLKFYSHYNGEIPRSICAEALAEIERLTTIHRVTTTGDGYEYEPVNG